MLKKYRLSPGKKVDLKEFDPKDTGEYQNREEVAEAVERLKEKLVHEQDKLFAAKEQSVLFVFQGMDCSGKDGVIKQVFAGVNPQGLRVHSFKAPTVEELSHDFLWRAHKIVPAKGEIAAFNRSYYEDVLITRVHGNISDKQAKRNFRSIKHFEKLLVDSNVKIVKIFINISKEFQLEKQIERLEKQHKHWKFDPGDLSEREYWDSYMKYYEEAFEKCSSDEAPWYIVPGDERWYRDYVVLQIALATMEDMNLKYPDLNPEYEPLLAKLKAGEE
ncbi:MAG: polyphosphate kinase 2 family protein [Gorillibacterium sp.]|nr:polyphosphate kinase 2 family protein [Gorillibacterium sp.]